MSAITPLPITGTRITITAGLWKGRDATVLQYRNGKLYATTTDKKRIIEIGPINPAHTTTIK